jgi:hypothetical protein
LLLLVLGCALISGCRPRTAVQTEAQVALEFSSHPPAIGSNSLQIILKDAAGQPLRLGRLEVEGNMNHAGMKPVFTHLQEIDPGRYAGSIEFTMGGDWFLLLSGMSSGGEKFSKQVNVPGVESK